MARSSYLAAGRADNATDDRKWEPRIDKDPFHRTMGIFNGIFKKKIKLSAGKTNSTDLHTIYVNFGEYLPSKITQILRPGYDDDHIVFMLECSHEWEGRKLTKEGQLKKVGDWGMCAICGGDSVYRGFEHEWQHIIFKTDIAAKAVFCEQYAEQLSRQLPADGISKSEISDFLHMLVNAFDDIRVNSLWEKVYPGSALAIWDRWQRFAAGMEGSVAFIPFIFAVAFNIPTNPQSDFEPMRPVIEWALKRIKYRGFNNMLLDVRIVIDRCMGAILSNMRPPAPKQMQPPPPPSMNIPVPEEPSQGGAGQSQQGEETQPNDDNKDENQANSETDKGQEDSDSDSGSDSQSHQVGSGQESESNKEDGEGCGNLDKEDQDSDLGGVPSAASLPAEDIERQNALDKLMRDPKSLDAKEEHPGPTSEDLDTAKSSQSLRAALNHILHSDISDNSLSDMEEPDGEPDLDMQAQIDQLRAGVAQKGETSQLTDGAKARVVLIKVTPEGKGDFRVELEDSEKSAIQRLRATFLRSMGKQKAKRLSAGTAVDVESLIQYLSDYQDPDVFENQDISKGFAYSVVSDMSGSMGGCFPDVCRAVEILKRALDFPFVVGNLWGFRGGQSIGGQSNDNRSFSSDVWMYQYDRKVDWYTGTVQHRVFPGPKGVFDVPVECGGITPMNSAINVVTSHLWRKMPAGMAKRMFLLTDGSPMQIKVNGRPIPEFILRQFVANEISRAWRHGIQVNTVIIGEHAIDDSKCLQMFGPSKHWIRVGKQQVGRALVTLVLRNFNRYLKRA
jgi:hypothetical protein